MFFPPIRKTTATWPVLISRGMSLARLPGSLSHIQVRKTLKAFQDSNVDRRSEELAVCPSSCLRPNPGQWGRPTVHLAGVVGIFAGVISSMIESVGDYHACARLSGAPPPPRHAINRGIGIEGLGCLLAGAWGTGNGTTSYSENVGALGITKVSRLEDMSAWHLFIFGQVFVWLDWFIFMQVGSRMVIVVSGILMVVMGVLGKVGAIFTTIPSPVMGGMFIVMFGVITAAGVSNLQVAASEYCLSGFIIDCEE